VLVPNTVPTMVITRHLATLGTRHLATLKTLSLYCRTQITPAVLPEYVKAKMVSASLQVNAKVAYAVLEFVNQLTVLLLNSVGCVQPTPHPVCATMGSAPLTPPTLHQRGSSGLLQFLAC